MFEYKRHLCFILACPDVLFCVKVRVLASPERSPQCLQLLLVGNQEQQPCLHLCGHFPLAAIGNCHKPDDLKQVLYYLVVLKLRNLNTGMIPMFLLKVGQGGIYTVL